MGEIPPPHTHYKTSQDKTKISQDKDNAKDKDKAKNIRLLLF